MSYLHAQWGSTVEVMEEGGHMQTTPPADIYLKGASPATPQPKWTKHSNPKHCNKTTANHSILFGEKNKPVHPPQSLHPDHSTQPLPAALLHLIGRDRLRPEALAVLAPGAWPAGEVAPGASPAPLGARLHGQIQRGRGVRAASVHTNRAGRRCWGADRYGHRGYTGR